MWSSTVYIYLAVYEITRNGEDVERQKNSIIYSHTNIPREKKKHFEMACR
jgi:hypothetical protein